MTAENMVIQTIEATVLEESAAFPGEAVLLAEATLAIDWLRPEEDAAWSHLQSDESFLNRERQHRE